ncbi:MAG: hypothetical protein E7527_06110 [Ruminococcaceae bacterium]|nr:hypothetical protein [Oscillospiraceae bacterium]
MNKRLRTLLCLLLSLALLGGLCACGEAEEGVFTFDPETYDPNVSYHVNQNPDGSYSFYVADYAGNIFYARESEPYAPKFTKLTASVLQITAPMATAPQKQWAVFCDVRTKKTSGLFGDFLVAKGNYVAQLEYLSDQYHVFVREIFNPDVDPQTTTLMGLVPNKDAQLYEKAVLNKDGNLEITYETHAGKKTVTIEMP